MEIDSGVVVILIALFVMITLVFVVLMFMLPEWFGISKTRDSQSAALNAEQKNDI
jgi:hypothetical protein